MPWANVAEKSGGTASAACALEACASESECEALFVVFDSRLALLRAWFDAHGHAARSSAR